MSNTHPTDFKIMRDGTWFHDGAEIKRAALAKLFADRALVVDEAGKYWLKTPYEQYPVEVEDVPFVIVDYDVSANTVSMKTNMDEGFQINQNTMWELRDGIPYVEVRAGLFARLGRSVLYNLIEEFGQEFESGGKAFALGDV